MLYVRHRHREYIGQDADATGQRASVGNEPTVRAGRHFADKTTFLSSAIGISWS
jgi:hypothetical protein